jgi:uncharacterized protein YjbI with pentapeptide repeats
MTATLTAAALKARWLPEALGAADRAFSPMDALASYQGRPPPHAFASPFGQIDGYEDFRHLPLAGSPSHRRIERADLSFVTDGRRGQLANATFVDCRFDGMKVETNLGNRFERCSFERAKLSRSLLRGHYVDCNFTGADLSRCTSIETSFVRCDFTGARLVGVTWPRTLFDHCLWEDVTFGSAILTYSRFLGRWPDNHALSMALLENVDFVKAETTERRTSGDSSY